MCWDSSVDTWRLSYRQMFLFNCKRGGYMAKLTDQEEPDSPAEKEIVLQAVHSEGVFVCFGVHF